MSDVKKKISKHIGKTIANAIVSRYYKGLEGDNSNAVLVMYE